MPLTPIDFDITNQSSSQAIERHDFFIKIKFEYFCYFFIRKKFF